MGAGGSAFNDLGVGALSQLGFKMLDANDQVLEPLLKNFECVEKCEWKNENDDLEVVFACDVRNPLLGVNGSTYIFGPQKGVQVEDLAKVDEQMQKMIRLMKD